MSNISKDLLDRFSKDIKCDLIRVNRESIIEFYLKIRKILFLDYYLSNPKKEDIDELILESKNDLYSGIKELDLDINKIEKYFYSQLPSLRDLLMSDIKAIYDGDPACKSISEVILSYPGFVAISAYRIAHILYEMKLEEVSRIISEYAHSITGIDINPGATIGESFFIDHGTGIVIGETSVIGKNVKIYQGVTLGALSLKEGRSLEGIKRHPTIEDNVVIYSGASIFGGDTIIGEGSTIGSSVFITESIPKYSKVYNVESTIKK